jgi:hypothetical protein
MKLRAPFVALAASIMALGCPSEGGVTNVLVVAVVEVTPEIREIILKDLADGKVDVVMRGHRLVFSNLGQPPADHAVGRSQDLLGVRRVLAR